jgi:hypothetical protein
MKSQKPFGERLLGCFFDILFGKNFKNSLFQKAVRQKAVRGATFSI